MLANRDRGGRPRRRGGGHTNGLCGMCTTKGVLAQQVSSSKGLTEGLLRSPSIEFFLGVPKTEAPGFLEGLQTRTLQRMSPSHARPTGLSVEVSCFCHT